ncbi:MAG: hypothetical protein EZS28_022573 [Streblomastix strix]|uniref:Uncharacterized protein n=1 Tax=Streblomastix strix TaxID=222440 RepID=A0A5J4VI05_9EUKA|nr:MAG: hypothetical protein EZS28_022573 [Streblomastix strix]
MELIDIPVELIAFIDEVGYQQYCDARRRMIIVRKANTTKPLHNPTDRAEHRISIMSGAGISGDCMLLFVILKKPVDLNQHLLAGTRHGIDVYTVEAEGTTMNGLLFCEFLLNYAVPFSTNNRNQLAQISVPQQPYYLIIVHHTYLNFQDKFELRTISNYSHYHQIQRNKLRRHNIHDTQEHITHLALSALLQALAQINGINSFKECGHLRRMADDGRVCAEIDNATFDSIIDSIEAVYTLLKFKGTRQT